MSQNWTDLPTISASDSAVASISIDKEQLPEPVASFIDHFGFTIPKGAKITGILVEIEHNPHSLNPNPDTSPKSCR